MKALHKHFLSIKKQLLKFFIKLIVVAAIVYAVIIYVIGIYPVHGNSNFPMLKDGDLAITQKAYAQYQTGDLVAYMMEGKRMFSRVVGVESDEITISSEGLLVNGLKPAEEIFYPTADTDGIIEYPFTVEEGYVFVLNDYRDDENDSRTYGAISISDLDGKVIFLFRRRKF